NNEAEQNHLLSTGGRRCSAVILSIIVQTANLDPGVPEATAYRALIENIIRLVEDSPEMARPVPESGPPLVWPPIGLDLESRAGQALGPSLRLRRLELLGIPVGRFSPRRNINQLVANSDYRKYDDGLRMTIDCGRELADTIEARSRRPRLKA